MSIFVLLTGVLRPDTSAAQTLAAQITYPADGATNADVSQPVQWTAVLNAQAYCLYLGSTLGANDLLNSDETQQTSYLAMNVPGNQTVFARVWTEVGGVWSSSDSTFTAVPVVATLTSPVNGATNVDMTLPMRWTTVLNAQAYYLYVGTTPGTNGLVNTGAIQQTSHLATGLPGGQAVFARVWTEVGGNWRYNDSSFTTAAPVPVVATLTTPVNGATNVDVTLPLQWTTVAGAQAYELYLGSTLGAKDLVDSYQIQQTSYLATGVPRNQTVFARLWTEVSGIWRSSDSSFTTAVPVPVVATLTSPVNGATNVDMTLPMQWTTVAGAQAYELYLGSTLGAKDLLDTGQTQQTSSLATGVSGGQTVFARLWTEVGGIWQSTDSGFTSAMVPLVATLSSPVNGATNVNMTLPMQWTTVAGAQAYELYLGSTLGAKDFVDSYQIKQTSYLATRLPGPQAVFARLWTETGGIWRSTDISFTTAAPVPVVATFTSPVNGATNVDMTLPMQWTPVAGAQAYELYLGSTLGAQDFLDTYQTQQTSYLATSVPGGQTVFARLWTEVGSIWRSSDSSFTTVMPFVATITSPVNGATNVNMTLPIQWTTVAGAQAYYLYGGSSLGANDLINTGEIQQTSYLTRGVPGGQTVFARMWTEVVGIWRYVDTTFGAASVTAILTYPPYGGVNVDQNQPATWTTIAGAQAYELYIGSTQGANDIADSSEILSATYPMTRLPVGPTLYARLWTETAGVWLYQDSTFTAAPTGPQFVFPADGEVAVDATQPFRWTPPPNASAQELRVGTSAGANDLFDSGAMVATSAVVNGLPITGALYARVLSNVNGVWHSTDIAFTLEASSPISSIVVPSNGQPAFNTVQPFAWSAVPLARGYRLTIGSTPGGNDLHDSGVINVTQRFVPALPLGLLYGRVLTNVQGQWQPSDFTFTVTANTASAAVQIQRALGATDVVRQMALADNVPFSWTVLAVAPGVTVTCVDYAEALLDVLADMNIQLPARRLDVALNPNGYDVHTLVEMFDPDSQSWMLLDPTFDLTVSRTGDGNWATAEDMSAATRAELWSNVSYVFLGGLGDFYARKYYLDYPLLFVDIYHAGQSPIHGQGGPVLPYMVSVPTMPVSSQGLYIAGCAADLVTDLLVNGVDTSIDCSGVDGLSYVFAAGSIAPTSQTTGSTTVYSPMRFVF